MNMNTALGLVVCGSGYGSVYAKIISRLSGDFRLEAILGRGSERSQALAKELAVPFVHNVCDLPETTRIAVVAVPSSGQRAVIEPLLQRDISVLCEYPIGADLLPLLSHSGTRLMVNPHLSWLPSVQEFLQCFQQVRSISPLQSIAVVSSERSLSSVLHILSCALGRIELLNSGSSGVCMSSAVLIANAIPINLCWSHRSINSTGLHDSVRAVQITAVFDTGSLVLTSEFGTVIWSTSYGYASAGSVETLNKVHYGGASTAAEFAKYRALANRKALMAVCDMSRSNDSLQKSDFQHLQNVIEINDQLRSIRVASKRRVLNFL